MRPVSSESVRDRGRSAYAYVLTHKIIATIAALVIIAGGYWAYAAYSGDDNGTRYVVATAEFGTIVSSVTASGQVTASNQVEIQPKTSGELISVNAKKGQEVKAGTAIAVIDSRTAQKALRDAETNLETALLDLEELKKPAERIDILQGENAVVTAQKDLVKSYDSSFNTVSDAFLDLPGIMTSLESVLYDKDVSSTRSQVNIDAYSDMVVARDAAVKLFSADAADSYARARDAYTKTFLRYRGMSRTADKDELQSLADESYQTVKLVADALKSANDYLELVADTLEIYDIPRPSALATHQSDLASAMSDTNSHMSSLLNVADSIRSAEYAIEEKTQQLTDLKAGPDALDIRSAELAIRARQEDVQDAREALADYTIRAPFDGIISALDAARGDTVGSGSIGTIITTQRIASLSVNEVDAARISVGNRATLTFDAVEELTLTGEVVSIDSVGSVSQGVVSYGLEIAFDTQDERVKPGMTVNAAIQVAAKQDVLVVPSSAVRTVSGTSFVQVFDPTLEGQDAQGIATDRAPAQRQVETGLSDDTNIEIISGLSAGEQIVVRTTTGTATATTGNARAGGATQRGGFGGPAGGAVFMAR